MENSNAVAVIGMGCRFPGGVGSPEQFWELLSEGRTGLVDVPSDRWNAAAFYHPDPQAREAINTKKGYFLKHDVAEFDARFFGFSSSEADQADPQQRILLETTYEALENAGIPIESLKGSDTSVFIAVFARDYDRMTYKDLPLIQKYAITGTGEAILAARISYTFDLRGGSMTLDTGCSGSLVAIHQACLSLRAGESRMAIAGGTELLLHPDQFVPWSFNGMANPEGQSFAFDSRGAGYGRGEGVGTVVLKLLRNAIEDGDPIHGVILNSGINQDGKTAGILLPNPTSQSALMKRVYNSASLDPMQTLYVEAHGTGTQAGDNAEIQSISEALCDSTRSHKLHVGSVKANIGHLEASSGIAGFIKAVMVLKKGQIPPQPNFIAEKSGLNLEARGIKVPTELTSLAPTDYQGPLRVSVSSYGYGGTNAHLVLESARRIAGTERQPSANGVNGIKNGTITNGHGKYFSVMQTRDAIASVDAVSTKHKHALLFPLTAHSEASLAALPANLQQWLCSQDRTYEELRNLSYTLCCRRSMFRWRKAITASTPSELQAKLISTPSKTRAATAHTLTFVFTGQGAQWFAMGQELIATSPIFRASLARSDEILSQLGCDWRLLEELGKPETESRIGEGEISQPCTTAVQIALVELFAILRIRPDSVIGHSSGEIAAAYAAGGISHEAAIQVSYFRGRVSAMAKTVNTAQGAMLAVACGEQDVAPLMKIASFNSRSQMVIACINSPESVTISGDAAAIIDLEKTLGGTGISTRRLQVDTAYHSHHMEKIAGEYLELLGRVSSFAVESPLNAKFYSSVTGNIKKTDFGASYWTENLVSQVRFSDALQSLSEDLLRTGSVTRDHPNVFIEIGPHPALQGPVRQTLQKVRNLEYTYCPSLSRGKDASETVISTVARLFEVGLPFDLKAAVCLQGGEKQTSHHCIDDLAPYPWDHRRRYWRESRLSRDHRLRRFPYHDLLGLLDVASTHREPRWRYHLDVERLPWLRHHVVEQQIIWPGTGYICMVIEAMKQLTTIRSPGQASMTRLILKNSEVKKSVVIPAEQADSQNSEVEIQLVVSPAAQAEDSAWESVRVLSAQPDGSWTRNFSGMVSIDTAASGTDDDPEQVGDSEQSESAQARRHLVRIQSLATTSVDPQLLYSTMKSAGNEFGPSFMSLRQIHLGKRVAFATMVVPDIGLYMPHSTYQSHVIHPAVLDVPNHIMGLLFYEECCKAAVMPTTTDEFYISAETSIQPGDELLIACEMAPEGKRSARGNTWLFKSPGVMGSEPALVCSTKAIRLRAIGEVVESAGPRPFNRKKNYNIMWTDHVDFLSQSTYHTLITSAFINPEERLSIGAQLELNDKAAAIYLERASALPITRPAAAAPHLAIFHDWISDFLASALRTTLLEDLTTEAEKDSLLQRSIESGVEGQMLARIGNHLPAILSGEIHALSIMVQDDLLNRFYMDGPLEASNVQAAEFVKLLARNKPHMSILEVGAGTGGTTASLVNALECNGEMLLEKYCYTDISAGFFAHAENKFSKWRHLFEFKVLDISKDAFDQGFSAGSYDLIVASNVVHATPRIADSLKNVRKLLRPGGRFVLVEMTRPTVAEGMIFGTLSGWWASEDGRKGSPLLTREAWHDALLQASFNGIEYASYDHDGPFPRTSVIVSKAVDDQKLRGSTPDLTTVTLIDQSLALSGETLLHSSTLASLEAKGLSAALTSWESLAMTDTDTSLSIVLDCLDRAVLLNPSPAVFERIKSFLTTSRHVLWVSYHESSAASTTAMRGLATGMARVLRRENQGMRFITLDVQDAIVNVGGIKSVVKAITDLIQTCLLFADDDSLHIHDTEFTLNAERLMVPRLHTHTAFNSWTDRLNGDDKLETRVFHGDDPLKLTVKAPGLLSSLCFTQDPAPVLSLAEDEIQLEAKAFGVNFRDVFIALGQMPPATPMAGEVAGVVTAIGSGEFVRTTFKVGDRVIGLLGAPYSSHTRIKGIHCQLLPASIGFVEGASIYTVFLTVYYSLVEIARLERGQSVLIHSASGGVGQAAIQLARYLGAEIFATVGSAEKRKMIAEQYGVPESHIISSRWTPRDMKRRVMQLTSNKGVNVVLNSLAGEMLAESWECLAPLGVHIELGKADIYKKGHLDLEPFDRNLTFAAVDLTVLLNTIPVKMFDMLGKILQLFEKGILAPVRPLNVMPIGQIEPAFRLIAERKHMGKVVLEVRPDSMVQATLRPPAALSLSPTGTYVVAGGLGDLGRRICCLLAGFGARHIVSLSRRTLDAVNQADLEDQVSRLGGKLTVLKCDITDRENMNRAMEECRASLPPIKGIIHGGMVLKDRPLESMQLQDWLAAVGPKVTGTVNLDDVMWSNDLDFFITLSSVSGVVGRLAQSNYAAGNCFQDAFVHDRNDKGRTRYFSVNIGAVTGSNSIASMTASQAQRELIESASMTFTELFQVLQYAMDPATTSDRNAQSAMGFDRQSLLSQDHFSRANPFFGMLPYTENEGNASAQSSSGTKDVGTALRGAKSSEEAIGLIAEATRTKLATFINRDVEDIDFDLPLSSFGMDSLVSIELKNWMMRNFGVSLQVSELTGQASISALSKTLVGRSTLVAKEILSSRASDSANEQLDMAPKADKDSEPDQSRVEAHHRSPSYEYNCCREFEQLPKQPIPDFEKAMEFFLENVAHFATDPDELESFRSAINDLTAVGGTGRQVYERLAREALDPEVQNWASDYLLKHIHLNWRHGLPFSSFMLLQHDSKIPHTQAERAAIIATSAFDYQESLKDGLSQGRWMFSTRQCNHLLKWLFNSNREPALGSDLARRYTGDYCAVLRRGRVFRVPLKEGNSRVSREVMIQVMKTILEQVPDEGIWIGILTSDNRDSWAKKRQELLAIAPENAEYLKTVEEAAFVLNLDDGSPGTLNERIAQATFNGGFNRWFDKPMQFIVTANGKSAVFLEHSHVDGVTALSLLYHLREAIESYNPRAATNGGTRHLTGSGLMMPREVCAIIDHDMDCHINELRLRWAHVLSQREFISHTIEGYGKNLLISHRLPIKGITEVLVQLASRFYHGWNPESWEGVSLAHFHHGRHDMVQVASGVVADFCASAQDAKIPAVERRAAMLRAANHMSTHVKTAMEGRGYFRLLNVIKELWPDDIPLAALFEHPICRRVETYTLVVTMLDPVAPGAGAMPANPQAIRVRYSVDDDSTTIGVIGPKGKVQDWARCLDEAAEVVKSLVVAGTS